MNDAGLLPAVAAAISTAASAAYIWSQEKKKADQTRTSAIAAEQAKVAAKDAELAVLRRECERLRAESQRAPSVSTGSAAQPTASTAATSSAEASSIGGDTPRDSLAPTTSQTSPDQAIQARKALRGLRKPVAPRSRPQTHAKPRGGAAKVKLEAKAPAAKPAPPSQLPPAAAKPSEKKPAAAPPVPPPLPPSAQKGAGVPPPPPTPQQLPPPPTPQQAAAPARSGPKLKPLPWVKLKIPSAQASQTIWSVESTAAASLDSAALEELFVEDVQPAKKTTTASKKKAAKAEPKGVSLLDPKRANNMCILLSSLKKQDLDDTKLRDALLSFDSTVLASDTLDMLEQQCPTTEELELVGSFAAAASEEERGRLGRAEQFVAELLVVPALKQRMRAVRFKTLFSERLGAVDANVHRLQSGCGTVLECESLRTMLQACLQAGNVLNAGSFRGNAAAADVGFLLQLRRIQCSGSRSRADKSLLGWICAQLHEAKPGTLETVVATLNAAGNAATVDTAEVRNTPAPIICTVNQREDESTVNADKPIP